ncbi:MAG: hypothetical protein H0W88_01420 [Parachlamydiaceae bacterium]|nr:hypothetical protein [Parachlamydiaceae bacterium]
MLLKHSLASHINDYSCTWKEGFQLFVPGLSPFAKRHWELSKESYQTRWGHRTIALIESFPLIGPLASIIELVVVKIFSTSSERMHELINGPIRTNNKLLSIMKKIVNEKSFHSMDHMRRLFQKINWDRGGIFLQDSVDLLSKYFILPNNKNYKDQSDPGELQIYFKDESVEFILSKLKIKHSPNFHLNYCFCRTYSEFETQLQKLDQSTAETKISFIVHMPNFSVHYSHIHVEHGKDGTNFFITDSLGKYHESDGKPNHYSKSIKNTIAQYFNNENTICYELKDQRQYDFACCPIFAIRDAIVTNRTVELFKILSENCTEETSLDVNNLTNENKIKWKWVSTLIPDMMRISQSSSKIELFKIQNKELLNNYRHKKRGKQGFPMIEESFDQNVNRHQFKSIKHKQNKLSEHRFLKYLLMIYVESSKKLF